MAVATQITEIVPAGMNVVIMSRTQGARWYKTQDSFVVDPAKAQGICPVRNRSFLVQTVKGITVWFSRNQIVRSDAPVAAVPAPVAPAAPRPAARPATPVVAPAAPALPPVEIDDEVVANFKPAILSYDIPTAHAPYSPVPVLRRVGFHLQGSVWVVDANNMPWGVINEMLDMEGVNVQHYKFEGSEARKLVMRAVETLQADIAQEQKNAENKAKNANTEMETRVRTTGMSRDQILAMQLKRAKAIQARLKTLEDDLGQACKVFGINPRSLNVAGLGATSRAIKADMEAQARTFRHAYQSLVAQNRPEATTMAAALLDGSLPPVIAADYLDEQEAGSGEALRTAFTEAPEVEVEDDGSDHTFSLTDTIED